MTNHLENLVSRFHYLELAFNHRKGYRPGSGDASAWNQAHREMFFLVQAISQLRFPQLQARLDSLRRDAMKEITKHQAPLFADDGIYKAREGQRFRWTDIQITPEVFCDISLEGARVSRLIAKPLVKLHKEQIAQVICFIHATVAGGEL